MAINLCLLPWQGRLADTSIWYNIEYTYWSTWLMDQQLYSYISIYFSNCSILLMCLIEEKIKFKQISVFSVGVSWFSLSCTLICKSFHILMALLTPELVLFLDWVSWVLYSIKKRSIIKIQACTYILFKNSTALIVTDQVKPLQLCWRGFWSIIYHTVTNIVF